LAALKREFEISWLFLNLPRLLNKESKVLASVLKTKKKKGKKSPHAYKK